MIVSIKHKHFFPYFYRFEKFFDFKDILADNFEEGLIIAVNYDSASYNFSKEYDFYNFVILEAVLLYMKKSLAFPIRYSKICDIAPAPKTKMFLFYMYSFSKEFF